MSRLDRVYELSERRGAPSCMLSRVSPLAHALQAATLAEDEAASPALVAAALLHDIGHLLDDARADIAAPGVDARHEEPAYRWLYDDFGPWVCEPVRPHVQARRSLCAVKPAHLDRLGAPSLRSPVLRGGPLSGEELAVFEGHPHA